MSSLKVGELYGELGLDDSPFNRKLGMAGKGLSGLTKIAGVVAIGVGAALAAGAVKGIVAFTEFEQQMNEVFTLLPGISQKSMDAMTGQVKDFAVEFGVLPDEVVPALYQSLSAGVPKDNVFEFLETAQKAAKGGVTDLTTAVDGISSAVNAYGPDVLSATQASDLMFSAVKGGKTTFEELSKSLFNVNPIAAALGVQFGDVTAALAAMTAQGIPTSVASTQLRQMFVELSKEGTVTSDVFKEIAGKAFKQFIEEGGNTQEALQLLEQHAADTGVGINDLFSSVEAGSAALALTGKDTEKFGQELRAAAESAGVTQEAYERMSQGIGETFNRIKARVQVALIELGDWLAPYVENMANDVIAWFDKIPGWWEENKDEIREKVEDVWGAFVTLVSVAKWAVTELIKHWDAFKVFMGIVTPVLVGYFTTIKTAQMGTALGMGASAGMAGLVVGAFATLTVQAYLLWTQWENLRGAVMDNEWLLVPVIWLAGFAAAFNPVAWAMVVVIGIVKEFGNVWSVVSGIVQGAITLIVMAVIGFMSLLSATISAWIVVIVQLFYLMALGIEGVMIGIWTAVTATWNAITGAVSAAASAAYGAVSGAFNAMIGAVQAALGTVLGIVAGIPGTIKGYFSDAASWLYSAGGSIITGLWNGMADKVQGMYDWVGGIGDRITSLKGPIEKDRQLLIPQGAALIQGLRVGMESQINSLYGMVGNIAPGISMHMVAPQAAVAAGSTIINISGGMSFPNVRSGADAEDFLSELASKANMKAASNLTGYELRAS